MDKRKGPAFLLFCYVIAVIYLTFFIGRRRGVHHYRKRINFALFQTETDVFKVNAKGLMHFFIDIIGNVFLFVPLIPLLVLLQRRKVSWISAIVFTLSCSITIELMQYYLEVGVCDINDVFLNLAGGLTGRILSPFFIKRYE